MLVRISASLFRPVVDHWQGRHPWLVTLIVSVIGVTYLCAQLLLQLDSWSAYVAIPCVLFVGMALLSWQIVGTVRAIRTSLTPPTDVQSAWGGYLTIVVAITLVGLTTLDGITRHLPQPVAEINLANELCSIATDVEARSVMIDGELDYACSSSLEELLSGQPGVDRVVLHSRGGHIFAARVMAQRIGSLGLDTHVERDCFSACTIAFMAGEARTLGPKGQLGFHRYAFTNRFRVQTVDPGVEQEKDRQFFLARGVRSDFLERVFQADNSGLWRPDHSTLLSASVITAAPQNGSSGDTRK